MKAAYPPDEDLRIAALKHCGVLDTPPEPEFDEIAALAAQICDTPWAVVSFVDSDRQWFKARFGEVAPETPRDFAMCAHALLSPTLLIVPDALQDPRFSDNPLVTCEGGIRFYAGAPLITPAGYILGTLCVFDRKPRTLTVEQQQSLVVLSRQVLAQLRVRQHAAEMGRAEAALLGILEDQMQVERALRASEERFRLLSSATNDAIWDWDIVTGHLHWNEGFFHLFGHVRDESEANLASWTSRIHPDDCDRVVAGFEYCLAGKGENWSDEYRFLCRDGAYAFVLDRGHIIRDSAGRAMRMISGMTDLTERRAADEKIAEQAALLDKAQDVIMVRDLEHRILYWNKSAESLYGWSAAEAVGRHITDLCYEDLSIFEEAMKLVLVKGDWAGEIRQRRRDGSEVLVKASWTLVRNAQGEPKSVLAINTDITEHKKLEQQFLRVQRMESIGTLAGGIAHDLNNVLTPIVLSIGLLESEITDPDCREILASIGASAQRGAEMVGQVLSFARGLDGERVPIQTKLLIRDLEKFIQDAFPKNIQYRVSFDESLWLITGDPTQLYQVLLNLCVNARDAMQEGGVLSISVENATIDASYAAMFIEAQPGDYVRIQVEDTGGGIPAVIIDKIFDPFFTTKEIGKGTGLGLSTTLAIVKSHEGFLRVYSEPGHGTRFDVYLPADPAFKDVAPQERPDTLPRGNGELILLVDDEPSIRQVTRHTLESFGYRVVTAENGAEALGVFALQLSEIALVLTDLMMPVVDGPVLIQAMRRIAPHMKIIAASGLGAPGQIAKAVEAGAAHFVPKPYTAQAILTTVATVLRNGHTLPLETVVNGVKI